MPLSQSARPARETASRQPAQLRRKHSNDAHRRNALVADTLTGGAGNNVFVCNDGATGGQDVVTNFNDATDLLYLFG